MTLSNNVSTPYITHLLTTQAWTQAQAQGQYTPASMQAEGFIHFSREDQVLEVANAFYREAGPLLLLWVEVDKLAPELKWEAAAHPEAVSDPSLPRSLIFPHLYGPLNLDAVTGVVEMSLNAQGRYDTVPRPPDTQDR